MLLVRTYQRQKEHPQIKPLHYQLNYVLNIDDQNPEYMKTRSFLYLPNPTKG